MKKKKVLTDLSLRETPASINHAIAEANNKEVYEKATPEQRKIIDEANQAMAEIEGLFFGDEFVHNGETFYKTSDTTKEVLEILKQEGIDSEDEKEALRDTIVSLGKGNLLKLGNTWYIKRYDNKLQEITKYVFTLEKMVLLGKTVEIQEQSAPVSLENQKTDLERLDFLGRLKQAIKVLKG